VDDILWFVDGGWNGGLKSWAKKKKQG
jgi:hypothetical protein